MLPLHTCAMPTETSHTVTVMPAGWRFVSSVEQTVGIAAQDAGIDLLLSCRNGSCRSCRCLATQGTVRYSVDWPGLSAEEKSEGWILPCVAVATSDLTLDAPNARLRLDRA